MGTILIEQTLDIVMSVSPDQTERVLILDYELYQRPIMHAVHSHDHISQCLQNPSAWLAIGTDVP